MQEHLDLLGYQVEDKVAGVEGVITSISFDLYGCIQAVVQPRLNKKDGKQGESKWFDVARLKITSKKPVMNQPNFSNLKSPVDFDKGPAEKPIQ